MKAETRFEKTVHILPERKRGTETDALGNAFVILPKYEFGTAERAEQLELLKRFENTSFSIRFNGHHNGMPQMIFDPIPETLDIFRAVGYTVATYHHWPDASS